MRLESVSVRYGRIEALRDVTCTLPDRGLVVLFGPNGAGKSSLMDVVFGSVYPASGRLLDWNGRRLTRRQLSRRSSRLFQRNVTPEVTARQLVEFAAAHRRWSDLFAPAGDIALPPHYAALVKDTDLESRMDLPLPSLSGGQQRICLLIAALLRPSPSLLLDEPFAGIAASTADRLAGLLPQEARNRLVLVIDHESDRLFPLADRLIGLNSGCVALDVPAAEATADQIERVYLG